MGDRYTILVVEDNPDDAARIQLVLAELGSGVALVIVESAEEAIAYLEMHGADMVILDLFMPGIGGMGFLEWYGDAPAMGETPVIVFTSSHNQALARRCFSLGAREVRSKDTGWSTLPETVQLVLARWRPTVEPSASEPR